MVESERVRAMVEATELRAKEIEEHMREEAWLNRLAERQQEVWARRFSKRVHSIMAVKTSDYYK